MDRRSHRKSELYILDSMESAIIEKIDDSRLVDMLYFPNNVFCMKECGDNALEVLYRGCKCT